MIKNLLSVPSSSDPEDGYSPVLSSQVRIGIVTDLPPELDSDPIREAVIFSMDDPADPAAVQVTPVSDGFTGRPPPPGAAVPVDDLENTDGWGISQRLKCFPEFHLHDIRMPRGMGDVDGEEQGIHQTRVRRSRRELPTTVTELNAIAAAASTGLMSPSAARGIPMTL